MLQADSRLRWTVAPLCVIAAFFIQNSLFAVRHSPFSARSAVAGAAYAAEPAPAAKPPITLKEFDALCKKVPLQGTDEQRRAFEKEVATFGGTLKGRTLADRVALGSASEMPRSPGKPKTFAVVCGPVKDPNQRLVVLLRTTSDKVSDMNPGTEFSFTGKVAGARYDATAMAVIVLVSDAAVQ